MKPINKRKLKYGSVSTVFTVLFVAVLIAFNVLIGLASNKYTLKFDMTQTGFYDLSQKTIDIISNLPEKVTITVLDKEGFSYLNVAYSSYAGSNYLRAFPELFKRYANASNGKIEVRYIDPNENPVALKGYSDLGTLNATNIIVEASKRTTLITVDDFFIMSEENNVYSTPKVTGLQAEQKITSAINYVLTEKLSKAQTVQGHNEKALSTLTTVLKEANYEVSDINLSLDKIADDVSLLVITSPKADFSEEEIKKLDAFFDRGGNAVITYDTDTPELSNLNIYLEEWGVKFERQLVLDDQRAIGSKNYIVADVASHDITKDISSGNLLTLSINSLSINILWDKRDARTVSPLLLSSDSSYAKTFETAEKSLDRQDSDPKGPFDIAVLSQYVNPSNSKASNVMFCSTYALEDTLLSMSTYSNKKFMSSALNYFNPNTESIVISPKEYNASQLTIQSWQAQLIFIILVILIPLVFIVIGIIVWLRRKNM